jgi:probable phosphoglycerate mutase
MIDITFVRHGEAARDAPESEHSDPGLSERGRQQAALLARRLSREPVFDALYTSPQRRARQTAAIVGASVRLDPHVEPDLAEFDRDAAEYIHYEDADGNPDPRYLAVFQDDASGWGIHLPDFRRRVRAAVHRLCATEQNQRLIIVTHGGVLNSYLGELITATRWMFFHPDYTSVNRVLVGEEGPVLTALNEASHLRGTDLATTTKAFPGTVGIDHA